MLSHEKLSGISLANSSAVNGKGFYSALKSTGKRPYENTVAIKNKISIPIQYNYNINLN